jgi:ribosomal protein L36
MISIVCGGNVMVFVICVVSPWLVSFLVGMGWFSMVRTVLGRNGVVFVICVVSLSLWLVSTVLWM